MPTHRSRDAPTGRGARPPPPCDLKTPDFEGFFLNYEICNFAECVLKLFAMWEDRGSRSSMVKSLRNVDFSHPIIAPYTVATIYEKFLLGPLPLIKYCVRHCTGGSPVSNLSTVILYLPMSNVHQEYRYLRLLCLDTYLLKDYVGMQWSIGNGRLKKTQDLKNQIEKHHFAYRSVYFVSNRVVTKKR